MKDGGLIPSQTYKDLVACEDNTAVMVANPKKLLYTAANPARGLLNRGKKKSLAGMYMMNGHQK